MFTISITDTTAYLTAISGLTQLTPKESAVLAVMIDYMETKGLLTLDDQVQRHVLSTFNMKIQTYYNFVYKLRKKKLLIHSHNKTTLKPLLLPDTVLQIKFKPETQYQSILEEFETNG